MYFKSNFKIHGIILCWISMLLATSCIDESPKLNRIIEFKADSLLQLEINNLTREADSACRIFHQLNHPIFLDSIVALRKKEILQLQQGL